MEENSRARPITESKQALTLGMLIGTDPRMKYKKPLHNIDQGQNNQVQIKNLVPSINKNVNQGPRSLSAISSEVNPYRVDDHKTFSLNNINNSQENSYRSNKSQNNIFRPSKVIYTLNNYSIVGLA